MKRNTNFITKEKANEGRLLGQAGELAVMSQIMARGVNVAQYQVDNGIDIITETGIKIQVKSSRKRRDKQSGYSYMMYNFQTKWKRISNYSSPNKSKTITLSRSFDNVDFLVLWCVEDNAFFIIPSSEVPKWGIMIYESVINNPNSQSNKYIKYLDNWKLIIGK